MASKKGPHGFLPNGKVGKLSNQGRHNRPHGAPVRMTMSDMIIEARRKELEKERKKAARLGGAGDGSYAPGQTIAEQEADAQDDADMDAAADSDEEEPAEAEQLYEDHYDEVTGEYFRKLVTADEAVTQEEIERNSAKDIQVNRKKHLKALDDSITRGIKDSSHLQGKSDEELARTVNLVVPDHRARYAVVPDPEGDITVDPATGVIIDTDGNRYIERPVTGGHYMVQGVSQNTAASYDRQARRRKAQEEVREAKEVAKKAKKEAKEAEEEAKKAKKEAKRAEKEAKKAEKEAKQRDKAMKKAANDNVVVGQSANEEDESSDDDDADADVE